MEESVKERLSRFIKMKGLNKKKFEELVGLSNGYIGSIRKSIGADSLVKIMNRFPELNRDWLLYGEGEMLKPSPKREKGNARIIGGVYKAGYKDDEVVMVDFVPVSASASFIESLSSGFGYEPDKYPIIPKGREADDPDSLKIFEVEGESMFPTIPAGSFILARVIPERTWHYAEGVVVAVFSDYVVVKRVAENRLATDNYITLSSDNSDYGEMTVPLADLRGLFQARRIISSDIR